MWARAAFELLKLSIVHSNISIRGVPSRRLIWHGLERGCVTTPPNPLRAGHRAAVDRSRTRPIGLDWSWPLDIYLVDGTYELFRHYYALPSAKDLDGREIAAVRGVLRSVLGLVNGGATHIAVATDHVIESFRNRLWPGYKTGEGIEPDPVGAISAARRRPLGSRNCRLADG